MQQFLKSLIVDSDVTNVQAGDYRYCSDFKDPKRLLTKNVLYNFGISGNSIYIGKFFAFAYDIQLILPFHHMMISAINTISNKISMRLVLRVRAWRSASP